MTVPRPRSDPDYCDVCDGTGMIRTKEAWYLCHCKKAKKISPEQKDYSMTNPASRATMGRKKLDGKEVLLMATLKSGYALIATLPDKKLQVVEARRLEEGEWEPATPKYQGGYAWGSKLC